jgi:hypothetical protein
LSERGRRDAPGGLAPLKAALHGAFPGPAMRIWRPEGRQIRIANLTRIPGRYVKVWGVFW